MRKKVFGGLLTVVLILGIFGVAFANPTIKADFNTTYGTAGTVLDQNINFCMLCHKANPGNGGNLNPYGLDLQNSGVIFAAVEQLDSDGDSFKNIVEITRRTFPGNATSYPLFDITLFDYDGDGITDVSACHLPSNQLFTDYAGNLGKYGWGTIDSMPLVWDHDGDGKSEISFYHIPTNQWFIKGFPGDNMGQFGWGGEESIPVPGDYNGDGVMERAFYHSPTNRWFVEGQAPVQFGWNGTESIPVPGDYDGDGKTDIVIYHIPSNQWFQYGVGNLGQFGWGGVDSIPVPGDYNGDGKTEIAIYHVPTNQWFVKGMGNLGQYGWGGLQSFPVPGDYDGDGTWERGFYRPSENRWFIEGEPTFVWGWDGSNFMPITSQIAVYNWFRFVLGRFL